MPYTLYLKLYVWFNIKNIMFTLCTYVTDLNEILKQVKMFGYSFKEGGNWLWIIHFLLFSVIVNSIQDRAHVKRQ